MFSIPGLFAVPSHGFSDYSLLRLEWNLFNPETKKRSFVLVVYNMYRELAFYVRFDFSMVDIQILSSIKDISNVMRKLSERLYCYEGRLIASNKKHSIIAEITLSQGEAGMGIYTNIGIIDGLLVNDLNKDVFIYL